MHAVTQFGIRLVKPRQRQGEHPVVVNVDWFFVRVRIIPVRLVAKHLLDTLRLRSVPLNQTLPHLFAFAHSGCSRSYRSTIRCTRSRSSCSRLKVRYIPLPQNIAAPTIAAVHPIGPPSANVIALKYKMIPAKQTAVLARIYSPSFNVTGHS
jgi:hypothetical protein